ncbi:MAG TPA: AraC family transcriptional regulator [Saprospiraceae bacterium]|nr:AraC family transcriptional regulator [Saprospiraceae bacterium]
MKAPLQKSPIPASRVFVIKELVDPYFDPHWHFHPEFQLFIVLEGSGTRFVGDHIQRFQAGDLVFTGPNLPHLWRSDPEYFSGNPDLITRGIVLYFHENFLGEDLLQKKELFEIRQFLNQAKRGMQFFDETASSTLNLMKKLLAFRSFNAFLLLLEILHTLAKSSNSRLLASESYGYNLKRSDTDRLNRVYDYIMENFTQKITLKEVADLAYMTPSSFSRYFKQRSNKTFTQLISELRIGHASKLLIEKDLSILEICYQSGFRTLSNFNRQFKDMYEMSPTEYRRLNTNQQY